VVVPKDLNSISVRDLSPFPLVIEDPLKDSIIVVDKSLQAFAAYNEEGHLVYWGPATVGRNWCPDTARNCPTPTGNYRLYRKKGEECISNTYPVGEGGTPMPYCMFFFKGYAIHGALLPSIPSTHGCVGIYNNDAKWLNESFVTIGKNGTEVRITE